MKTEKHQRITQQKILRIIFTPDEREGNFLKLYTDEDDTGKLLEIPQ